MAKNDKIKGTTSAIKLKINRKENDHTHFIGILNDGRQFMAFEVFFHVLPILSDWQKKRKEFVVIHLFDIEGKHIESKHQYVGTTAELDGRELKEDIEKLFVGLGKGKFTDIAIQPFEANIDGFAYGLVQDNENYCFNLIPNDLSFSEPFEGEYDE